MDDIKRFKTDSVAKTRQLIDENPYQSKSGVTYTAPIINRALSSEELKQQQREKDAERKRISRQDPDVRAAERDAMARRREDPDVRAAELLSQRAARLASSPEASDSRRQVIRQLVSRTRHDPDSSRAQRDAEISREYRQANPEYVEREHLRLHQMYHAVTKKT